MKNPVKEHPYISAAVAYALGKGFSKKGKSKRAEKEADDEDYAWEDPDISPEYVSKAVDMFSQAIANSKKSKS